MNYFFSTFKTYTGALFSRNFELPLFILHHQNKEVFEFFSPCFEISSFQIIKNRNKWASYYSTAVVLFIFLLKMNGRPLFLHCILCSKNNIENKISSRINSFHVLYYKLADPLRRLPLHGGPASVLFFVSKF